MITWGCTRYSPKTVLEMLDWVEAIYVICFQTSSMSQVTSHKLQQQPKRWHQTVIWMWTPKTISGNTWYFSSCRWRQLKLHSTIGWWCFVQSEISVWFEYTRCPSILVPYLCMGYLCIIFWWSFDVSWIKYVIFFKKNDVQFVCSLYAVLKLHTLLAKLHTLLSKLYVVLKVHINCI